MHRADVGDRYTCYWDSRPPRLYLQKLMVILLALYLLPVLRPWNNTAANDDNVFLLFVVAAAADDAEEVEIASVSSFETIGVYSVWIEIEIEISAFQYFANRDNAVLAFETMAILLVCLIGCIQSSKDADHNRTNEEDCYHLDHS